MYKGIIFSILCMPLINFGMDRDITDQGFNDFDMMLSVEQDLFALEQRTLPDTQGSNDPDLQAAVLSLFTDDDSLASSQSNAVNTQLHFPDLQSAESGVLYCDEILGNDADKEDTQLSALYDDSTPQHMQARYDAINMQGLNDAELQAIILNFTIDNPSAQSQSNVNRQELHFPDLQLAESGTYDAVLDDEDSLALREIQKRYEEIEKSALLRSVQEFLNQL